MPYIAYCGRAWLDNERSFTVSEDGKTLTVTADQTLACDDDAL